MIMSTIQKIIKIGSSKGVTLPAKQLKALGVTVDDEVRITVEAIRPSKHADVMDSYEKFKKQYNQTLENLVDR